MPRPVVPIPTARLAAIPFFLTTEYTEHTEKNPPTVMSSFRVFGVFRGSLPCGLIGFTTDGQSPEHRAEFRVRA